MRSASEIQTDGPHAEPINWVAIAIAAIIFSVLSVWMAIASVGFLEADGMTHYLARRFALDQPIHLVSIWNRPFCVLLYCVPAKLDGLRGTRLMSLFLVLVMAAMTLVVAKRLPIRRPTLAALLLLTQPLLFAHSFSELTEVPFALLLIVMFWAYQRRHFWLLASLTAIAPLARPEGFGLILLVGAALVLHRRWWWLPILPIGLMAWSWIGWHAFGNPPEYPWWRWLPHNWPYSADSVYGRGSIFKFAMILPSVVGPIAFGFMIFGIARIAESFRTDTRKPGGLTRFFTEHDTRCTALVAIIPLGVLVAHSTLWALGKMASNGEPRYMLIVAPFWALLATIGLDWFIDRFTIRRPGVFIVIAALIPIMVNATYPAFPLGPQDDDRIAIKLKAWLDDQTELRREYPVLAASLPHLFMLMDEDRLDKANVVDSSKTVAKHPPPGVMLVWSTDYSTFNSDQEYCVPESMLLENGWREITRLSVNEGRYKREAVIYVSPQPK